MVSFRRIYQPILALSLLFLIGEGVGGQDSRNGYWFPARDTIRILIIYAEMLNDPDDPGDIRGWKAASLPPDPLYLFDHELRPGVEPKGFLTKYYHQASFGKYIVLADYYPGMVSLDYNTTTDRGFDQVMNFVSSTNENDIITYSNLQRISF